MTRLDMIAGCLLGQALGDSVGLLREGLSRQRALRMYGAPPFVPELVLGRGFGSDDTEHACLVGQALLIAPDDAARFSRSLAWGLRWWLAELPAGIGFATLRSILKLWIGIPPRFAGVRSAGNGALMRAPLVGACLALRPEALDAYADASTHLTHREPRAEQAARLVAHGAALGARLGAQLNPREALRSLRPLVTAADLGATLNQAADALSRNDEVATFADALGLQRGVSGFVNHTLPVAVYAWLRHPGDFRRAIESVVELGGDTDTVGAITGGLVGATVGRQALPAEWIATLSDWPRTVPWIEQLAERLATQFPEGGASLAPLGPMPLFGPAVLARNVAFMAVVLTIGLRRLLPPY